MTAHQHSDEFDRGLHHDLPRLLGRRRALQLLAGGGAAALASSALLGNAVAAATLTPTETAGPYPGDGSNGPNVLNQSGVVRSDITSSFGSMSGTASGVPTTITLRIVDITNQGPLVGAAVYLWHCTATGGYSLYSSGITNQNYLRGVQVTDANGEVTFTTIYPGCYSGRWPHAHFEVYPDLASIASASNVLLTSQIAFPKVTCDLVYATSGYAASVSNLASISLATDNVFRDDSAATQLATITGTVAGGLAAFLEVGVDADGAGTVATSAVTITPTTSPATVGAPSAYTPLATPARLLDTRTAQIGYSGSKPAAASTTVLHVLGRGNVPASDVSAVVLSVVMAEAETAGFLTVWPSGTRPTASAINADAAGQTRANLVTVPVAADGTVRLYTSAAAHVIADALGWFRPAATATAGRLMSLTPARIVDTRTATRVGYSGSKPAAGATVTATVLDRGGVPASGVAAVVLNVTATETAGAGFVTAWPDGTSPSTSNVNADTAGQTVATQVVVPIGADGTVPFFVSVATHLLVDVYGWYTDDTAASSTDGLFVPVSPYRVADTRDLGAVLAAGGVVHLRATASGTAAAGRTALATNIAITQPAGPGFVTAWPEGTQPGTSNLNHVSATTIANHAVVATGTEGIELVTSAGGHLVVDVSGWYT